MAKKKTSKKAAPEAPAAEPAPETPAEGSGRETIQIGAFTQTHMIVMGRKAPAEPAEPEEKANIQRVFTVMSPKRKGGGPAPGIGSMSPSRKA